jgi:isopentenyl diphosphate isomerase/L-lactate dehydrogenase-like FMN-dependent dehydrogenase
MDRVPGQTEARRRFLRMLVASPLFAGSHFYSRLQIRSRRLVNVETIDMSVHLFGTTWSSPIVIAPVSSQKAFHPDRDIAVARAAHAKDHLQIFSTAATSSIEDVIAARRVPVLAAFGQAGVEAVLEILRRELTTIMRQAGTTSVNRITRSSLVIQPS